MDFIYCNVNSYLPKKYLINNTIEKYNIKSALFVETKTKPQHEISYRNWDIIKHDGNITNLNTRGGSLAMSHSSLNMKKCNGPLIRNPLNEVLHIIFPLKNEELHVFLLYVHPNGEIEETILNMAVRYQYCIIIGDLNLNTAAKHKKLKDFLKNSNCIMAKTPPTFLMPNNNDSTPDRIIYSNSLDNCLKTIDVIPDLGADHQAIIFKLQVTLNNSINDELHYNFHKSNIKKINTCMEKFIEDVSDQPLDRNVISDFLKTLEISTLDNTPKRPIIYHAHELPPFIIRLIKIRRRMYREYKCNPQPEFKTHINRYNKNIHKLIQDYKQNKWLAACEEINNCQGKRFFQEIKKLSGYKKAPRIKTIEENGITYNTDAQQAELFGEHFSKFYNGTPQDNFDRCTDSMVNDWNEKFFRKNSEEASNNMVNQEEYFNILQSQKNTAPGPDSISWRVVKNLSLEVHLFIISIFQFCLNKQYFPPEWKIGDIIVIHKSNSNPKKINNYRPITLLPTIGKLFEKTVKFKLSEAIAGRIPIHQFGFREHCSTLHPLTILSSNVQTAKLNNLKSAALFLDIQKAFDSVWYKGLLYKLYKLDVPTYLIEIIKEFLTARKLRVKIGNNKSQTFTIEKGLPQGSPLSPLLYKIYCHDMPASIVDFHQYVLQFADDTALVAHKRTLPQVINALQELIEATIEWLKKWKLQLNPLKTELIIFNHKITSYSPSITIFQHNIQPKANLKYLGFQLDQKLNFKYHSNSVKKRVISRAEIFRSLTYKDKGINRQTAAIIYKSICRPLMDYGHNLYLGCRRPTIRPLETAETTAMRKITKIRHPNNPLHNPPNPLLYKLLKVEPIADRIRKLSMKFAQRPNNWEILEPHLIQRNQHSMPRAKYPLKTIREHLEEFRDSPAH